MKIVLSRKGFDAANGGVPSPILPDGALCWLPIPDLQSPLRYRDIRGAAGNLGPVVSALTRGRIDGNSPAHLDPDLHPASCARLPGWRPLFGQAGAAQSHLRRQGVGPGDLFLFYGWFRQAVRSEMGLRFQPHAPDMHVIYGWMQVAERLPVAQRARLPEWSHYHPHVHRPLSPADDSLYVAADVLSLDGRSFALSGGGTFPRFDPTLCLTAAECSRSIWRLPGWFAAAGQSNGLSYHGDRSRWRIDGDRVLLRTVGRGQEFVLDGDRHPEALGWVAEILGLAL